MEDIGGDQIRKIVGKLLNHYDYVLADAPAGLTRGLKKILYGVDNTLLVVTPDDVSIRDAERIVTLCREEGRPAPMIIVNRVIPALVQSGDMYAPQTVADTLDVPLLGYVPEDAEALRALHRHQTFMETDCPASHAVERIARRLMGFTVPMPDAAAPVLREKTGWFSRSRRKRGEQA